MTDGQQGAIQVSGICPTCGGPSWTDGTQQACRDCGGGQSAAVGPDPVQALRSWFAALCPRCGADRAVSFGAQYSCGRCGAVWQA